MIWLLYYWRLEKEKWFDQLILAIKELNKQKIDFEIFIFGSGSLEAELLKIKENNVHYFGWQPLERIKQYLANIDYCVMPSEFLETFGLSALNALSRGLPVIWYKKWWLDPFIFQECNLFLAKGNTTSERLTSMITKLSKKTNPERIKDKSALEEKIQKILPNYTEESWVKRFEELYQSCHPECNGGSCIVKIDSSAKLQNDKFWKKIILVSDFINKAWWIETYIHDVKKILENVWYEVILRWWKLPSWFLWKFKKWFWLVYFPFNRIDAYKFKKILKKENPDLIWFNSLLRWLGPNVVKVAGKWRKKNKSDCKLWMMYHDFWYFYAYPSQLFHIEDCKTPLNLKNFLSDTKGKFLIWKCAIFFKYLWLQPLKKTLKKEIDLHLSPSGCVSDIARDSYQISQKKCKTLEHFIQK